MTLHRFRLFHACPRWAHPLLLAFGLAAPVLRGDETRPPVTVDLLQRRERYPDLADSRL